MANLLSVRDNENLTLTLLVKNISAIQSDAGIYQKVLLRDQDGNERTAMKFDSLLDYNPPCLVNATIKGGDYLRLVSCEAADGAVEDYLPHAEIDVKAYWSEFNSYMRMIRPGLARICCYIAANYRNDFINRPLKVKGAFARTSGLFEATVKLMRLAVNVAPVVSADTDLCVAAAALAYIGDLKSVNTGFAISKTSVLISEGARSYAVFSAAVNDLMENDAAREDIEQEDLDSLGHAILTRGRYAMPLTLEAEVIRDLDLLVKGTEERRESMKGSASGSMVEAPGYRDINYYNYKAPAPVNHEAGDSNE